MQNQTQNQTIWVDIQEYSRVRSISISTIRRRIKCNQIKFKLKDGKYLLEIEPSFVGKEREMNGTEFKHRLEIQRLKMICEKQREELEELRMLVEVLERRLDCQPTKRSVPPTIPRMESENQNQKGIYRFLVEADNA